MNSNNEERRGRRATALWLAVSLLSPPSSLLAFHVTPLARVTALGGQYFTGETDSSGVNTEAYLVPVVTFSPRLHLIPIYMGSYRRVQSVYNFLGENTLIDKNMEHTGVLRLSWQASAAWRIKPRSGYKRAWVKQSSDDSLSGGLFNNGRMFGGASVERLLANGSFEIGYDYSMTRYPNYQAVDADPRLTTTGITSSAGTDVLDYNSHETSLQWNHAAADKRWDVSGNFTWLRQHFIDQKVISQGSDGFQSFVDKKRHDDIFNLALNQNWRPNAHWSFGLGETVQHYVSNQNAFDATQLYVNPFTYRYYDFTDTQLLPQITRKWLEGTWETTLSGQFGYRRYSHRRAQDGSGTYLDKRIWSANRGGSVSIRYKIPKVKGLFALMTASVVTYWSNTRYETNYPYNYTTYNYLGGLSWEY